MSTPMFHLAFPVRNLESAREFYINILGATVGRKTETWMDVFLWGAQLTLHERPDEVPESSGHGVRHFGATLDWVEWEAVSDTLLRSSATFVKAPSITFRDTAQEQAKLVVQDPSGNRIEVKAYRDPAAALISADQREGEAPAEPDSRTLVTNGCHSERREESGRAGH